MRINPLALIAPSLILLGGCSNLPGASPTVRPLSHDWRAVATNDDRERLRGWRDDFVKALAQARASGHGGEIDREGALLRPDAAQMAGLLPNGRYRCRVIKLGTKAKTAGLLDYVAYAPFACRVQQEKDLQGFAKLSGSQRPVGLIFRGDAVRHVFLGTLVLGDESRPMQYGRDPDRDMAAWVERIGDRRWRMVFPSPRFESRTDIIELVPEA